MNKKMAINFSMDYVTEISNTNMTVDFNGSIPSPPHFNELLFDINYRVRIYLLQPAPIIALVLAFVGITFNLLSVIALCQIRSRLNTHYRLIVSLAVSDALIGISVVLYIANKVLNPSILAGSGSEWARIKSRCAFVLIKALNTTSLNISLLNLMGMSVDHYTAITKPLRYHKLLGKGRARIMIVCLWTIAFLCGFSDFLTPVLAYTSGMPNNYNYCEIIWLSKYQEEYSVLAIAFVCFFVMLFIYVRICLKVNRHKLPGERCPKQTKRKDEKKNGRALVTTLLILGSFIVCWLPTCLFQITMLILVRNGFIEVDNKLRYILASADKYLVNLLLVNCICDAVIYTLRCKEVRLGYKKLFCYYRKSDDRRFLSCRSLKSSITSRSAVDKSTEYSYPVSRRFVQQLQGLNRTGNGTITGSNIPCEQSHEVKQT